MPPPSKLAAQAWTKFVYQSLASRLDREDYESYVQLIATKHPLPALQICALHLRPSPDNGTSLDPRVPQYLQVLLRLDLITFPSILRALHKYSTFGSQAEAQNGTGTTVEGSGAGEKRWTNSYAAEEMLFYRLAKYISSGTAPSPQRSFDAIELLVALVQWMELIATAGNGADEILNLGANKHVEEIAATTMALGTLAVAVVENPQVLEALSHGNMPKGTGKKLSATLANLLPILMQSSPQIATRLEAIRVQTLSTIEPLDKKELAASKEIDDMLGASEIDLGIENMIVQDLPPMNSRSGLYIYLNSLLVGRPLMDDHSVLVYLHNRYQGDVQTTAIDLILASFDMLANATILREGAQTMTLFRSFLINKVPLLLATLSTSFFPPLTAEHCITDALAHVDTNIFPTFSTMFSETGGNDMFSDSVRQDFCFACCLHGLLAESKIESLLGDIPMQSLPESGRLTKDALVELCFADSDKAEGLIEELEYMDGNVGAVSQAITEFLNRLSRNKDTMSLKSICSKLARKATSLDIMLLFDKPITILHPLCELLDNWRYDDDQGEYQPVYEEFGSILLLVLAFVHRYNLSPIDLGIYSTTSFISKLLSQGHLSRAMENLSRSEQDHLDGWIKGLFDSESGGLGDELMSSCPPQDFYLLVPTLFHNIVLACSTNHLSDESLRGGLEFLVDTFLLPSLVPGITWLSHHLWENRGDANAVLQILGALINNPANNSNNPDSAKMLNSIMNIIAKNLEHSLRFLQRAEPTRQDVEPLSKLIRMNLGWERRGASDHTELEGWTATARGGLAAAVKHTITLLLQWSINPGINIHPATYTHRQILVALRLLGAKRLLGIILEEVKTQTELGNGSAIIDVATSLICAPEASSWEGNLSADIMSQPPQPLQRRMNLREALKIEAENMPRVQKTNPSHADTVIRIYRRVEAQMVVQQPVLMVGAGDMVIGEEMTSMGDDLDLVAGSMGATMGDPQSGLEDVLGGGVEMMGSGSDLMDGLMPLGDVGGMDMDMEVDDIFGGLGTDGMDGGMFD